MRAADVRAFYEARQWQAAWDGKSEKQLLEIIDAAPTHGLKRELFLKGDLPKDQREREVALTKAALRYASALAQGYSDPKKLGRSLHSAVGRRWMSAAVSPRRFRTTSWHGVVRIACAADRRISAR